MYTGEESEGIDLTLIFGKFSGGNVKYLVVLLIRFHIYVAGNLEKYTSDSSTIKLFDEVKVLVPNGMVLCRTGGSVGEKIIDVFLPFSTL